MIEVNGVKVEQNHFCSGELKLKIDNFARDMGNLTFIWNYENDSELFTIICLAKHFNSRHKVLIMPYLPHARMDRVHEGDVFTLKYFCEVINSLNFNSVLVSDPHSNVGIALLNNVVVDDVHNEIRRAITYSMNDQYEDKDLALFFPDEGAMKRYGGAYPNHPMAFGIKKRDWETHKIESLEIMGAENIKDKDVLIIDDICSYGNTFVRSAEALRKAGAKSVNLYITHAENSIAKGDVFEKIDKVFTTHSLVHTEDVAKRVVYVG